MLTLKIGLCCLALAIVSMVLSIQSIKATRRTTKPAADWPKKQRQTKQTDSCELCLRWSECNGSDKENCPLWRAL